MKKLLIGMGVLVAIPLLAGWLLPKQTTAVLLDIERDRAGLVYQTATTDEFTWHFLAGGPEDAETIVLLHGFGGDKDNWIRFAGYLTDDYRVLIPDLPGFGATPRNLELDYGVPAQGARLDDFLRRVAGGPVHLAGHSMGGHIAGWYAHEHPERLQSLLLVTNAGIRTPEISDIERAAAAGDMILAPTNHEEFRRLLELASYEPPFIPWPVGRVLADESIRDAPFKAALIERRGEGRSAPLEPLLPAIDLPVLVVWGQHDRFIHVSAVDVMRSLKPDARYEVVAETGHLPMIEKPATTAGLYRDFLSRVR